MGAESPWIVIDLEKDCKVSEVETIFEYTNRTYRYRIEYLTSKEATDTDAAAASKQWHMFADRTAKGAPQSPVKDTADSGSPVKARYIKLTIEDADVPFTADGADLENAKNGWSIFEIRVF